MGCRGNHYLGYFLKRTSVLYPADFRYFTEYYQLTVLLVKDDIFLLKFEDHSRVIVGIIIIGIDISIKHDPFTRFFVRQKVSPQGYQGHAR